LRGLWWCHEGVSSVATKLCERQPGKQLFDMLPAGDTLVAHAEGLTKQTVYRIKAEPRAAEAALVAWGL
jgi:hypothetical protein